MFDPDFARAFVDGRFYGGFSHEAALRATTVPVLLPHANWNRRFEKHGLAGAMDDDDAARVRELAPQTVYRRIDARHVSHDHEDREYLAAVGEFADSIPTTHTSPAS